MESIWINSKWLKDLNVKNKTKNNCIKTQRQSHLLKLPFFQQRHCLLSPCSNTLNWGRCTRCGLPLQALLNSRVLPPHCLYSVTLLRSPLFNTAPLQLLFLIAAKEEIGKTYSGIS